MAEYRVIIPTEKHSILQFRRHELPGIAVVNSALVDFEPKAAFAWHCSLMLKFEDLVLNGMPSRLECGVVDPFGDALDAGLKGNSAAKPNALFLARVTWNETRELIYRVFDPKPADRYLADIIEKKSHPREFEYRINPDPEWKLARWFLDAFAPYQ